MHCVINKKIQSRRETVKVLLSQTRLNPVKILERDPRHRKILSNYYVQNK